VTYTLSIDPSKTVTNPLICGPAFAPTVPCFGEVSFAFQDRATAMQEISDGNTTLLTTLTPGDSVSVLQSCAQQLNIVMNYDPRPAGNVGAVLNDSRQAPGPLPVLGAGIALAFSRKLRSRIDGGRSRQSLR
jgi:hypothetical protein